YIRNSRFYHNTSSEFIQLWNFSRAVFDTVNFGAPSTIRNSIYINSGTSEERTGTVMVLNSDLSHLTLYVRNLNVLSLSNVWNYHINGAEYIDNSYISSPDDEDVIESGSNENGNYTIFSDGTMICTTKGHELATHTATNSLYRSESSKWTFPKPFSSRPNVHASSDNISRIVTVGSINKTYAHVRQYSDNESDVKVESIITAIGRV